MLIHLVKEEPDCWASTVAEDALSRENWRLRCGWPSRVLVKYCCVRACGGTSQNGFGTYRETNMEELVEWRIYKTWHERHKRRHAPSMSMKGDLKTLIILKPCSYLTGFKYE